MGMSMDADDGATSDLENRNEKEQRRDRKVSSCRLKGSARESTEIETMKENASSK